MPALLLARWQAAISVHLVPPELLPRPTQVARAVAAMVRTGELWLHLGATLGRLGLGFTTGAGCSIR